MNECLGSTMKFQVANAIHEAMLRDISRASSMPGWVRIAFGRDPDFFHAVGVQGKTNEVLIATEGDAVVGMGSRSTRPVYVNGDRLETGYLGGLRLQPDVRGTGTLGRGYAALKVLHVANPVPFYLTTVIESNRAVRTLLTSGRAGLPHYRDCGRYVTYAISMNRRPRRFSSSATICRGDEIGVQPILSFLNEVGRQRQFFPVIEAADVGSDYLRQFNPSDFRVAMRGADIAGVATTWDQRAFKQNIVDGYSAVASMCRPAVNVALRVAGFQPLPAPGQGLDVLPVAFHCVRNDDPNIMRALLETLYREQQCGPQHFLILGLHERDPLREAMSSFLSFRYISRLYLVCWEDGLDIVKSLDPVRIPHLEVATL